MSIQIYVTRKNFDVQKAERFFKERRVPVQVMDISPKGKHKLGARELQLFAAAAGGLSALIDRADKKVQSHPACYYDSESLLEAAVLESPWLLRSPIVRCGSKAAVGCAPELWEVWAAAEKAAGAKK